jgi:hypothetical protein
MLVQLKHDFEMCDSETKHIFRNIEKKRKNKVNNNLGVPTAFSRVMMQGI